MSEQQERRYGARVNWLEKNKTLVVLQTIKSGPQPNAEYVIDDSDKWIPNIRVDDDRAIANAVRQALRGQIPSTKSVEDR